MIQFSPTKKIYPDRLSCIRDLKINTNQFRKLYKMRLLVPVFEAEDTIKQEPNLGKIPYEVREKPDV